MTPSKYLRDVRCYYLIQKATRNWGSELSSSSALSTLDTEEEGSPEEPLLRRRLATWAWSPAGRLWVRGGPWVTVPGTLGHERGVSPGTGQGGW